MLTWDRAFDFLLPLREKVAREAGRMRGRRACPLGCGAVLRKVGGDPSSDRLSAATFSRKGRRTRFCGAPDELPRDPRPRSRRRPRDRGQGAPGGHGPVALALVAHGPGHRRGPAGRRRPAAVGRPAGPAGLRPDVPARGRRQRRPAPPLGLLPRLAHRRRLFRRLAVVDRRAVQGRRPGTGLDGPLRRSGRLHVHGPLLGRGLGALPALRQARGVAGPLLRGLPVPGRMAARPHPHRLSVGPARRDLARRQRRVPGRSPRWRLWPDLRHPGGGGVRVRGRRGPARRAPRPGRRGGLRGPGGLGRVAPRPCPADQPHGPSGADRPGRRAPGQQVRRGHVREHRPALCDPHRAPVGHAARPW